MSRSTALEAGAGVTGATTPFPFLYQALRVPVRAALERWFDLSVEGLESLPPRGPRTGGTANLLTSSKPRALTTT